MQLSVNILQVARRGVVSEYVQSENETNCYCGDDSSCFFASWEKLNRSASRAQIV